MFCYQCEQTAKGEGCSVSGVCGKKPEVAALQDLLVYALQGLAMVAVEARKVGVNNPELNQFTNKAMFSTLTNVNFDPDRFPLLISGCVELREQMKVMIKKANSKYEFPEGPATFTPEVTLEGMIKQGEKVGLKSDPTIDPDVLALQHTMLFGLKGVCAYADHALILGKEDDGVYEICSRGIGCATKQGPRPRRLGRIGSEVRRSESQSHGVARCRQYGNVRASRSYQRTLGCQGWKGHPGLRP